MFEAMPFCSSSTPCSRRRFSSRGTSSSISVAATVPGRGEYMATWTTSKRNSSSMSSVCWNSASLSPKADDDVRRESDLRQGLAQTADQLAIVVDDVAAPHATQYVVVA